MWSKGRSPAGTPPVPQPWSSRPLAGAERALFAISRVSPLNLVVLVRLTGPALGEVLPQALAVAQDRHPLLRARIAGRASRPRFEVRPPADSGGPGPIPLRLLTDSQADGARPVVEEELNTPFDTARGPMARATLIAGAGPEQTLVLTVHHCIADGASAAGLVHELLERCGARSGDTLPSPSQAQPPPALTAVLPARLRGLRGRTLTAGYLARQAADEVSYRRGSRGLRRPMPPPGRTLSRPVTLAVDGTTSLVDRARRSRLTLTSVLCAALLEQASTVLYGGRPVAMRAVVWVDLRRHLDPPVPQDVLGCYASMLRFVIRVDPGAGLGALSAQVQAKIEQAARRGDRIPAALTSPALSRMAIRWPLGRLGTIALSYAVAPAIGPAYGPLTVREVRAFVSNQRLGADLAAACGVWGGALWCDLLYLDSDIGMPQADAVCAGLMSALGDFAQADARTAADPTGQAGP
jgi:hypothetical protein